MMNFDMMSVANYEVMNVCRTNKNSLVGERVADIAKGLQNPRNRDWHTIQIGDIIHFPSTIEDFDKMLISVRHNEFAMPIIKLMVVVQRQGMCFATPITKDVLCRFGIDEKGNKFYSDGAIAEDFQKGSSLYDAFVMLVGKTARVVDIKKIAVRCLRRGAMRSEDGRFYDDQFCYIEKPFYEMEYVPMNA